MKTVPSLLKNGSSLDNFRLVVCDLNGLLRGKRFPSESLKKIAKDGSRMPVSTSCIDIWGMDLLNSPYLFHTGDADGFVMPTESSLIPINWLDRPTAILPSSMYDDKGEPSPIDPRHVLDSVLKKYSMIGLRPVIAFELEFYLLDLQSNVPVIPKNPISKKRLVSTSVLSIDELDAFESFFSDVSSACKEHKIPADTAISENGVGQFEINLKHTEDSLAAADQALFLKRIIKGVAQKHSLKASFMAKPFLDSAGNGMHLHMSILDKVGSNIFDSNSILGTKKLGNAIGGLISALKESTLVFAPHLNSYRRLKPGSHAPTSICWGYENRTASIRIPGGDSENTRIEHRVAGADANPYLVAAAILSAALSGIQKETKAPHPLEGDSYSQDLDQIPSDWLTAINLFKNGTFNKTVFSNTFIEVFSNLKQQEFKVFSDRMEDFEILTYLDCI
jgi:glutamine synthetase